MGVMKEYMEKKRIRTRDTDRSGMINKDDRRYH